MREWRVSWLVALSITLIVVGIVLSLFTPRTSRATKVNFDRVEEGMNRARVESILGSPGDYRTGPTLVFLSGIMMEGKSSATWQSDEGDMCVAFDASGNVSDKRFWYAGRVILDPKDKLIWRAKHRWKSLWEAIGF